MSTNIRPELSQKNKYYVEKHRYYELKHFCLQYPVWKKAYYALDGLAKRPYDLMLFSQSNSNSSPTERCALSIEYFYSRMRLVEEACDATDSIIGQYILHAVTEGCSYEVLRTRYGIPCCKDIYYELYRKFFWILNKSRD